MILVSTPYVLLLAQLVIEQAPGFFDYNTQRCYQRRIVRAGPSVVLVADRGCDPL
jgi:hypothetical protein